MKTHLITSPDPIASKKASSVCGKACKVMDRLPTDLDLQSIEVSSLSSCRKCVAGKLEEYVYVGTEEREQQR